MQSTLIPIDTGRKSPYMLEITHLSVSLNGLPPELEGAVVVHLTDLHGGYGNLEPVYHRMIEESNALSPLAVLLTGDYIDDHSGRSDYAIEDYLLQLTSQAGTFASFGNHDHRRGIEEVAGHLKRANIHILNNEAYQLPQGLWLVGIDDLFEGYPDVDKAFAEVPANVTPIVLSHTPRMLEHLVDRDSLLLSGHTHGGQICLPFPSPKLVISWHLRCKQVAGEYSHGKSRLYLSRGIGVTGRPFRYKCPAEMVVLHLTCV